MKKASQLDFLFSEIESLIDRIPMDAPNVSGLMDSKRKRMKATFSRASELLAKLARDVDTVAQPDRILDPASPRVVADIIINVLLKQPRVSLEAIAPFYGSGIYALYYRGNMPEYSAISGTEHPIYVGKSDPKTHEADTPEAQGEVLHDRLVKDHARSIRNASNLFLEDFECRFLVVKSAWQRTAECYLIDYYKPVWNKEMKVCQGFGKHGDSASTRRNRRSKWDTLHPGRHWATESGNVDSSKSRDQIAREILNHFKKFPPRLNGIDKQLEEIAHAARVPGGEDARPENAAIEFEKE